MDIIAQGLDVQRDFASRKERDEKVYAILEKVGLSREQATRFPHQFSGGQRQRIGIARALVMLPKLVIADECISALDVSIQAQVVNLMRDPAEELDITYLFIAHDLSMVKYISDRIGIMHYGHIVETGTTDEIFQNPVHPYTRSLLSAILEPNPAAVRDKQVVAYDRERMGIDYTKGELTSLTDTHQVIATKEELAGGPAARHRIGCTCAGKCRWSWFAVQSLRMALCPGCNGRHPTRENTNSNNRKKGGYPA